MIIDREIYTANDNSMYLLFKLHNNHRHIYNSVYIKLFTYLFVDAMREELMAELPVNHQHNNVRQKNHAIR